VLAARREKCLKRSSRRREQNINRASARLLAWFIDFERAGDLQREHKVNYDRVARFWKTLRGKRLKKKQANDPLENKKVVLLRSNFF
jgi:hypothetical protein